MRKTTTSAPRQVRPRVDLDALAAALDVEEIEQGSLRAGEIDALLEGAHELMGCSLETANDHRAAFLLDVAQRIAREESSRLSSVAGKLRRIVDPPFVDAPPARKRKAK